MQFSFGECNALLQLSIQLFPIFMFFDLWVDHHIGQMSPPHLCFPYDSHPSSGLFQEPLFFGWPLNLFSKCAVICCWLSLIFCQSCDKTCNILLLISQHTLRKRQSEDGAAGGHRGGNLETEMSQAVGPDWWLVIRHGYYNSTQLSSGRANAHVLKPHIFLFCVMKPP